MESDKIQTTIAYILRIVFVAIIIYALYLMVTSFPSQVVPDYLGMYLRFMQDQGFNSVLGFGIMNSRARMLLAISALVTLVGLAQWVFKRWNKNSHNLIVTTNWPYFVVLWIIVLFTTTFDNAANNYDWYWDPVHNVAGRVDVWTHMLAGINAAFIISAFNFERPLRLTRKWAWLADIGLVVAIAAFWEFLENLYPEFYFNLLMNSLQDLVMTALVGGIIAVLLYEKLVDEMGI